MNLLKTRISLLIYFIYQQIIVLQHNLQIPSNSLDGNIEILQLITTNEGIVIIPVKKGYDYLFDAVIVIKL